MRLASLLTALLLGVAFMLPACGGDPKVDKENIRRNADDATNELDRESAKHPED